MASTVRIEGISKAYTKDVPVLLPLDVEVKKGELFFLLGPSGCGKSTLLRIIAGLVTPDEGKIFFDGEDVTFLPPEKRRAAMVFQNYALWPHMTVFENVAFGPKSAGLPASKVKEKVEEALALVRMSDFAARRPPSLSGGQQQRVALARAIAVEPRVLLLDEPLSNLDAKLRDEMRLEIKRVCKEHSLTAIYVTHDRREALGMGDRIALLEGGKIRQLDTPVNLYKRPCTRFAASFLGGVNFLRGRVKGKENGLAVIETDVGTLYSANPLPVTEISSPGEKSHTVLIRPEHITVAESGDALNSFKAKYESGTFLGERSEMLFRTENGRTVEVNEDSSELREKGREYLLSVLPANVVVLED